MVIQIFVNYIDSNEETRKVDSWVKIEERSYVPFDMLMRHRVRNLGSTNSAIIYIKVFLKAGFGAVTFTKRSIWLPILHSYVQPSRCVGQLFSAMDKILQWLTKFKIKAFFSCSKIITKT